MEHRPNVIAPRVRITLAIIAVCLLAYICVGLATGYTYLPARRGGFFLPAIPTFLLTAGAGALLLASLLTIADHYDRRPNERIYAAARAMCLKVAACLVVAAPALEVVQHLSEAAGVDVLPRLHGLAEDYTFYRPELSRFAPYFDPFGDRGLALVLLFLPPLAMIPLVKKFLPAWKRLASALVSVSMLNLCLLLLMGLIHDFLAGETTLGKQQSGYTVSAVEEPAKFNAVLLSEFALCCFVFALAAFLLSCEWREWRGGSRPPES